MFAIATYETEDAEADEYTNCILFANEEDANEHLSSLRKGPGYHVLVDSDAPDDEPEPPQEIGDNGPEDISREIDPAFSPENNVNISNSGRE